MEQPIRSTPLGEQGLTLDIVAASAGSADADPTRDSTASGRIFLPMYAMVLAPDSATAAL